MPKPLNHWLGGFLRPWDLGSPKKIVIFIYSALLGMLTHVIWDAFTHAGKLLFYSMIFASGLLLSIGIIYIKTHSVESLDLGSVVVTGIDALLLGILLSSLISRAWHKPKVILKEVQS